MTGLMAARRLNSRLPRRDALLLAARVDLELLFGRGVVAAIAGIGVALAALLFQHAPREI